jgi:arylsulfatase
MPENIRNVLLFLTDQQRKDSLGAYGNPIARTPNFDRIAGEGVRFQRAYTQNPFCCPARASILTGTYPRTHGMWHNGIQFLNGVATLGDILQKEGFRTGSVGKIHLNPWFGPHPPVAYEESRSYWEKHPEMAAWHGPYVGFQEVEMVQGHGHYSMYAGHYAAYLKEHFPEGAELLKREKALKDEGYRETWHNAIPEEHHYNTWIADRTVEMIDRFAEDRFFIHCSFPDPHHPFTACEPYASMYSPKDMPDSIPPSLEELERMPPYYLKQHQGQPSFYDGKPPNFSQDIAGAPLRGIKAQTYGMVTHVDACIGRIMEHLESRNLLDKTLILFTTDHGELLGDHGFLYKGPFYYQCLVNVPLLMRFPGQEPRVVDDLVAHVDIVPTTLESLELEIPTYLPGNSLAGCSSGRPSKRRDAVLTEFRPFGCPNMKVLHTERWKYTYYEGEEYGELFDLAEDPEERRNLFDDPGCRKVKTELEKRLLDELVATEAPWPPRGNWQ